MKKILLLPGAIFYSLLSFAAHITGGEMYYTFLSQSGTDITYQVTLKLYRDCFSTGAQLDPSAPISIFRNDPSPTSIWAQTVPQSMVTKQNLGFPSPCIQNPPVVCYDVGFYTFTVTLPISTVGYTIAYQRCCRIAGINNLNGSSSLGATYTATIPGTNAVASGPVNSSARFIGVDTVIVCAGNSFCYDFGAVDADPGDVLTYNFCDAYVGGSQTTPAPNPPSPPPYSSVTYASGFNASSPLGPGVTINPGTGLMCGIAPAPGIYVVTVCVNEYRNGQLIATQRKDLQIKIGDCNVADADLKPEYITCDGFTFTFSNESPPNPLVTSYYWELSDGFTSTQPNPIHTFADTGIYNMKLVINRGKECTDSVTSKIKVYPGFFPGFISTGICLNKPIQFTDTTRTNYGTVNTWRWNFGDIGTLADTSRLQNPNYTYNTTGPKTVSFIVSNSKGCTDTVDKIVDVLTKPPLSVSPKDTLICNGDPVQLHAVGNGNFSWTPLTNIINSNTADPTVSPSVTTTYTVLLDDQGCINQETVRVRVVDFVTLRAIPDTTICATDTAQLGAFTDGLRFLWDNVSTLNNPTLLRPLAKPSATTTYTITASIGSCTATDDVVVKLVPYPGANAGNDTTICYSSAAQLNGTIIGTSFTWSPVNTLINANTLTPTAQPKQTTAYVLSVFDTQGCPKPGKDTVLVTINPEVVAFAGRDTAVVIGQPLQFNATGGVSYFWSPPVALNNANINNPKAFYDGSFDSIRYTVQVKDAIGCSDEATVLVKIFKTKPIIFVPTAFTPNGDGKNEFVAPIAVGITQLDYFRIYNRWGQMVFETRTNGKGWDGKIAGKEQGNASFVWIVKATDFTGKVVFQKGTVTLIR